MVQITRLTPEEKPAPEHRILRGQKFSFYYAIFSNFSNTPPETSLELENYTTGSTSAEACATKTEQIHLDAFIQQVEKQNCQYNEKSVWQIRNDKPVMIMQVIITGLHSFSDHLLGLSRFVHNMSQALEFILS